MFNSELVQKAFTFAMAAHADQTRKGGTAPYILHPMGVASLVLEHGGTQEVVAAAMLHDVVEDCDVLPLDLEVAFGIRVKELVLAVSNDPIDWKSLPKEEVQLLLREFRSRYFEKIRTSEVDIQLLSACDKLHNARTLLGEMRRAEGDGISPDELARKVVATWNSYRGKRDGTLWYMLGLSKVYSESESDEVRLVGRLLRNVYGELSSYF